MWYDFWKTDSLGVCVLALIGFWTLRMLAGKVVTLVHGYPDQPPATTTDNTSDDDDDDDDDVDPVAYLTPEQIKDLVTQLTAEVNKAIVNRLEVVSVTTEWTDDMIDALALRIHDRMVELEADKASTPEPTTTAASSTAAIKPSDVAVVVRG